MERRNFLKHASAGALTEALGTGALLGLLIPSNSTAKENATTSPIPLHNQGRTLSTESADLSPYVGAWGEVQLRHLLRRAMFGVPESQFLAAQSLGSMDAVVTQLLACQDVTKVPLPAKPASWVDNFPDFHLTGNAALNQSALMVWENIEIGNWWFDQMMQEHLSIRQKLTMLWTNHFVTGWETVNIPGYMYYYLMVCMTNALGNFKDFTTAIATCSAMLSYLNGDENYVRTEKGVVKSFDNENLPRELMELFTMGLNFPGTSTPNYTQADIENSALALTGWQHSNYGTTPVAPFTAILWDGTNGNPNWHDDANKTFLGQTGNWGLADVIDIIFQQPTTSPQYPPGITGFPQGYTSAYWACQKLYKAFVYYNPSVTDPNGTVRDAMARLMLQNNFNIAPVMQALLTSAHFYDASVIGAQIKSPAEYMGSLVREYGLTYPAFDPTDPPVNTTVNGLNTYTDPNPALSYITNRIMNNSLGQQLLNPPNVAGWPGGENWLSSGTFQSRQNFSNAILNNKSTLAFSETRYAGQIANASTLPENQLFRNLENISLAFALGQIESSDLAPNPTKTDDVIGTDVPTFAVDLSQLPEFQLL